MTNLEVCFSKIASASTKYISSALNKEWRTLIQQSRNIVWRRLVFTTNMFVPPEMNLTYRQTFTSVDVLRIIVFRHLESKKTKTMTFSNQNNEVRTLYLLTYRKWHYVLGRTNKSQTCCNELLMRPSARKMVTPGLLDTETTNSTIIPQKKVLSAG